MCYKKPGPRCSSHAKQRLVAAQRHLDELRERGEYSWEDLNRAERDVADAELEYESTPLGMKGLQSVLSQMEGNPDLSRGVSALKERIEKCREYRILQLAAIKEADKGDIDHTDEVVDYAGVARQDFTPMGDTREAWYEDDSRVDAYEKMSTLAAQRLNDGQIEALRIAADEEGSMDLNAYLSSPNRDSVDSSPSKEEMKKHIRNLDRAFKNLAPKEKVVVYQTMDNVGIDIGMGDDVSDVVRNHYGPGTVLDSRMFSTASFDPGVAQGTGKVPVVMEIKARSVLPTGEVSERGHEYCEVLMDRKAKYRVTDVGWEKYGDPEYPWEIMVIQAEEIDPPARNTRTTEKTTAKAS